MFDLTGRTALVTGASGGLGQAIARALHAQGASVALTGTRREALETLAAELGIRAHAAPCDLADATAAVQVKLLRVLQKDEIERLRRRPAPGRSIAAWSPPPTATSPATCATGRFREDLYHRLNVIHVRRAAAARATRGHRPRSPTHFLARAANGARRASDGLTPEAEAPALRSTLARERARTGERHRARRRALAAGRARARQLPEQVRAGGKVKAAGLPQIEGRTLTVPLGTTMDEIELRVIRETLRHTKGNKNLAAQLLGIAALEQVVARGAVRGEALGRQVDAGLVRRSAARGSCRRRSACTTRPSCRGLAGDAGRLGARQAAVEGGPARRRGPAEEHHPADHRGGDGHDEHRLLPAGEALEQPGGAVLEGGEVDGGHQSGMFMICVN